MFLDVRSVVVVVVCRALSNAVENSRILSIITYTVRYCRVLANAVRNMSTAAYFTDVFTGVFTDVVIVVFTDVVLHVVVPQGAFWPNIS